MQVHGYEFTPINDNQAYSVNLTDEVIVVDKAAGDKIAMESQNADEVRAAVLATKESSSKEWKAERSETTARSTRDENARLTAQDASSGESHQESERQA